MSPARRRPSILLALLPAMAAAAGAQTEPSPLPGVFGEILDVRVVNLEVVVTDKEGLPVFGLGPQDFVLRVDGEEVPVEYFTEVRGGLAAELAAEGLPAGVESLPAVLPGDPVGTSYLLFIDEFFSITRDRDRVLEALKSDLPLLGRNDRMAVVAFDGKKLEMLSSWDGSVPALERVLDQAMQRPALGLQRLAEQRQFDFSRVLRATDLIRGGSLTAAEFFRTDLNPEERFYVQRLVDQLERTVTAATSTLRSFAKPPGRKVMLLLSGGWPFLPSGFLSPDAFTLTLQAGVEQGEDLFGPLVDTANLLGYTLYPVDVPGFSDEVADAAADSIADAQGFSGGPLRRDQFLRRQEIHYTLDYLARQTGGRAFVDAARLEALDKVVIDTRSYYWLGFSPRREWDNKRHRLEVEVRGGSLRVRSRADFLDSSRQREVTMAVESTLLFGNAPAEEMLKVEVGAARKAGRGKMTVPLTVLVPLGELTFLPAEGGPTAQLELRVAVQDDDGQRADIPVIPIGLSASAETAAAGWGRYETTLRLRRKPHDAVVAVYDPLSGRILTASARIAPSL